MRNLDEREKQLVRSSGVHVFTMKDIDRAGIAAVAEQAVAIAKAGTYGIHASFDLDVCDPAIAPGVGTPVKGGISWREGNLLMEMAADSDHLCSLEITELNPILDVRNTSGEVAVDLICSAFGKRIL